LKKKKNVCENRLYLQPQQDFYPFKPNRFPFFENYPCCAPAYSFQWFYPNTTPLPQFRLTTTYILARGFPAAFLNVRKMSNMHSTEQIQPDSLQFRPIEPADEALLLTIYASTRAEEMEMVPDWTAEQKTTFLTQQFQAQHQYYQQMYKNKQFGILLYNGQPAGRLYLDHRADEVRIVDIALLPDFRGRGLGESTLRGIMNEATAAEKRVTIHVERQNRARHLYDRLGFCVINEDNPVYLLMEWRAS
jgi:ribosomal protein S18 acetylase RimI-like enzyme